MAARARPLGYWDSKYPKYNSGGEHEWSCIWGPGKWDWSMTRQSLQEPQDLGASWSKSLCAWCLHWCQHSDLWTQPILSHLVVHWNDRHRFLQNIPVFSTFRQNIYKKIKWRSSYLINIDGIILLQASGDNRTKRPYSTLVFFIFLSFLAESARVTLLCEIHILGPTTFYMSHTWVLCDQTLSIGIMLRPGHHRDMMDSINKFKLLTCEERCQTGTRLDFSSHIGPYTHRCKECTPIQPQVQLKTCNACRNLFSTWCTNGRAEDFEDKQNKQPNKQKHLHLIFLQSNLHDSQQQPTHTKVQNSFLLTWRLQHLLRCTFIIPAWIV